MSVRICGLLACCTLLFSLQASQEEPLSPTTIQHGRILFLIQQGEQEQALNLYQNAFQKANQHDFELLHQIGLRLLDEGFRQKDPECQLLALFGAGVSAHEDVYYILEEGLKNKYPEIQLVALEALARFQTDKADQALIRALGSPILQVRYEAAHQLCKKKHPQAVSQTESLLYKSPSAIWPIYPPLFAMTGDTHSTKVLRKLMTHSDKNVRLAVILSIAKYDREDLLPQVRQQSAHMQFTLQEACANSLGRLQDEEAIPKLERLVRSQYPAVSLAAQIALYRLGHKDARHMIENAAQNEDIFAIAALGTLAEPPETLLKLLESPNLQVRINAVIALLEQDHPRGLEGVDEILLKDKRDLAFTSIHSAGKTLKSWKVTPSASSLLKDDSKAYQEHLELKETLLRKVRLLSEPHFIATADQIFLRQQNDLVPTLCGLLEEINTKEAVACLKRHQQQLGAPLVRNYCNLSLYRLNEPGPYADHLREWVKAKSQTEFIRLKPVDPWDPGENSYTLKPEETSKLLIEIFEAFAAHQDAQGIEIIIEAIATGHAKNKYALAGLLLRATQ